VQLSCISFCSDGHTIAVGTEIGGKCIIYDLKEPKKIKFEFGGHDPTKRINAI